MPPWRIAVYDLRWGSVTNVLISRGATGPHAMREEQAAYMLQRRAPDALWTAAPADRREDRHEPD